MGITHNPASPGTFYCENGGTWFLGGNQVTTFSGSSSYQKEDIPPGKKITWDSGTHIINNPNNYSYEIKKEYGNDCTAYTAVIDYFDGTRCNVARTRFVVVWGKVKGIRVINSGGQTIEINCNGLVNVHPCPSPGWYYAINSGRICNAVLREVIVNNTSVPPTNKLEITDDNIVYTYTINNTSSVQVVDIEIDDNKKFIFNTTNGIVEVIANKNSTVSVECNCPQNTLDCGDCCLPCDEILNEISSIRSLLAGIV